MPPIYALTPSSMQKRCETTTAQNPENFSCSSTEKPISNGTSLVCQTRETHQWRASQGARYKFVNIQNTGFETLYTRVVIRVATFKCAISCPIFLSGWLGVGSFPTINY